MSRLGIMLEYYVGKILELFPVIFLAGALCVMIRWRKGKRLASCRSAVAVLFSCYIGGLLALTAVPNNLWTHIWYVLRYHRHSGISFQLFTFEFYLIPDFWRNFRLESLGNLVLYVPFGFFVPLLWERWGGWRTPVLGFGLCLGIETIQLFVGRCFDVNDLILNTAGAVVGYLLFLLVRNMFPGFVSRCRTEDRP